MLSHVAADERSCERVKTLFLAAASGESPCSWVELWRALTDDPWCQAQFAIRARRCVEEFHAPVEWAEEVSQHALVMLAHRLKRTGFLGVDVEQARKTFPGWFGGHVDGLCQNALHYVTRLHRPPTSVPSRRQPPPDQRARDLALDLTMAINRLDLLPRALMQLELQGHSLAKASEMLGLTRKRARLLHAAACAQLRRELKAYRRSTDPGHDG